MAVSARNYARNDGHLAGPRRSGPQRPLPQGSRLAHNSSDVSIQVDVVPKAFGSSSSSSSRAEMGRKKTKDGLGNIRKGTPLYSHEDIREQYCINKKELEALETARRSSKGFFGCLASRKENPCKKRKSFFALCVRRGSDENLQNHPNKPVNSTSRSATLPSLKQHTARRESERYEQPLFKSRPQSFCTGDPKRFSNPPSAVEKDQWDPTKKSYSRLSTFSCNDDSLQRPFYYGGRLAYTQPNTPELSAAVRRRNTMSPDLMYDDRREKHVSFDASSPVSEPNSAVPASTSQERLLDGRKTPELFPNESKNVNEGPGFSPMLARAILLEKLRQASMRCQATQTEEPYSSFVVSTTSLSYPVSCLSSESISAQTREIQTTFEPKQRGRLVKSYSEVDNWNGQSNAGSLEEFPPHRSRSQEMTKSRSAAEEIAIEEPRSSNQTDKSSPEVNKSSRKQLLKALSEGTILLDRKHALSFATGYVEVSVHDRQCAEEEEEAAIGRVVVHDLPRSGPCIIAHEKRLVLANSGSSEEDSAEINSIPFPSHSLILSREANRLLVDSKLDNTAWSDSECLRSETIGTVASSVKLTNLPLPSQKSFESSGSLPDTPGNHSDEFGSMSQVTVLLRTFGGHGSASPNSSAGNHAFSDSERHSTSKSILGEEDSEKEIMVQFPPWPHADDLIPAPPNFASSPPPNLDEVLDIVNQDVEVAERPRLTSRAPLREMQSLSKSLSETITSVESDSEHRVTEHETSQSSDAKSEESELPSPEHETKVEDSVGSSEAFVTAISDNAETVTSYRTAIEKSLSDGSRNSTLRTDLSCEDSHAQVQCSGGLGDPDPDSEKSSSSGSYSLETQPDEKLENVPEDKNTSEVAVRRKQNGKGRRESAEKRLTKYFGQDGVTPEVPSDRVERDNQSSDRVKLKESLKLQFPPGTTMFTHGEQTVPQQPQKPSRKKTTPTRASSSPSDDESCGERPVRRQRNPKTPIQKKEKQKSKELFTPAVENKDFTKTEQSRKSVQELSPGMVRSPAMHEGFRTEDWVLERTDSKEQSPVKHPDPAVLIHQASECQEEDLQIGLGSPNWLNPNPSDLHARSCESLRSASPGSDSVFVSELAEPKASTEVFKPPDGFADSPISPAPQFNDTNDTYENGAKKKRDSNRGKRAKSCSLPITESAAAKKDDEIDREWTNSGIVAQKSISTSEMWYPETQLPPTRQLTVRAKSEERDRGVRLARRQLARSVDASWESLGSRTSHDGTPLDDEDEGIYDVSYRSSAWIYIGETEELKVWQRPSQQDTPVQEGDDVSTTSEKDFRRKYTAITHRMVHRKSSVEMYRRLATSTFDAHHESGEGSVRQVLEDVYQLMLVIWCRENHAIKLLSSVHGECDEIVLIKRDCGEFGFRIHGSRPVVVSAIEPNTPAEESGLHVGDIIIAINGVNVLDSSHSEVVRIAHTGCDELKLEVARTCHVLGMGSASENPERNLPIMSGYLWKKSQSSIKSNDDHGTSVIWCRRWFSLQMDNCLYYYKNETASQPLGAISLLHYVTMHADLPDRNFGITLSKGGVIRHYLAAETEESALQWERLLTQASVSAAQNDVWLTACTRYALLPPTAVERPDCVGHLMKLGHRAKAWQRRFCLLKDASLFFYVDSNATSTLGVLCLHGYRVQSTGTASSAERRKFAFELMPPEPRMRHFHFYTDSDNDRKRWIAALEYSIDRWVKVA